jgi:hypothetical protein
MRPTCSAELRGSEVKFGKYKEEYEERRMSRSRREDHGDVDPI